MAFLGRRGWWHIRLTTENEETYLSECLFCAEAFPSYSQWSFFFFMLRLSIEWKKFQAAKFIFYTYTSCIWRCAKGRLGCTLMDEKNPRWLGCTKESCVDLRICNFMNIWIFLDKSSFLDLNVHHVSGWNPCTFLYMRPIVSLPRKLSLVSGSVNYDTNIRSEI